jgi:DNA/RNA endonuclease G (NUC1)
MKSIKIIVALVALSQLSFGFSLNSAINDFNIIKNSISENTTRNPGKINVDKELVKYINKENCDQIIDQQVFQICYDYSHRGAKYVGYVLDGSKVNAVNIKARAKFYSEDSLSNQYRTKTADYSHTGYDRGHMA